MRYVAVVVFLFAHTLFGQAPVSGKSTPTPALANEEIASEDLIFSSPNLDAPLSLPSPVMSGAPTCGGDGRAFLQIMTPPPRYTFKNIYSVTSDGKITPYPVDQIVGIVHPAILSFDPGASSVAMILAASAAGEARPAGFGYYLTLFSYDGKILRNSRLDLSLEPSNVAQINDDSYLVTGTDPGTAQPKFLVIDSRGTLLRDIDTSTLLPSGRKLATIMQSINFAGINLAEASEATRQRFMVSLVRPVHSDQGLLMFMPGSGGEIIVFARSGEIRQVRVNVPSNQIPDSLITAKGRWFLRTYLRDSDNNWSLYEIDPDTGRTLRKIYTAGVPSTTIACATDSGFFGLRWIDKKPYVISGSLH
jgi:hypothetical protein